MLLRKPLISTTDREQMLQSRKGVVAAVGVRGVHAAIVTTLLRKPRAIASTSQAPCGVRFFDDQKLSCTRLTTRAESLSGAPRFVIHVSG